MVDAGLITEEQALRHPLRNVVTRSLGTETTPTPDLWVFPPHPGERFVICSDGLSNSSPRGHPPHRPRGRGPRAGGARAGRAAVDAGGRDNVTAIVVALDVGDDDEDFDADTAPRSGRGASVTEVRVSVQDPQQGWTRACRRWCPRPRRLGCAGTRAGAVARSRRRRSRRGPRRPHCRRRASAPDYVAVEEGAPLRVVARGRCVCRAVRSRRGAGVPLRGPRSVGGRRRPPRHHRRGPAHREGGVQRPEQSFSRSRPPSTRPRRSCTRPRRRPRSGPGHRPSGRGGRESQAGSPPWPAPAPATPASGVQVEDLPSCTTCSARPSTGGPSRCSAVPRATRHRQPLRARHRPRPRRGCGRLHPVTPRVRADPSAAE